MIYLDDHSNFSIFLHYLQGGIDISFISPPQLLNSLATFQKYKSFNL